MESETSDNRPAAVDETSAGGGVLRIVLLYAVAAALWIVLSDAVLGFLWDDPKTIALASTLKGWAFVAVTALLLFVLLRRQRALQQAVLQRQEQAEQLRLLQLIERQREERSALTSHYETLLRQARDIILLINVDGEIVEANDAAVAAYGSSGIGGRRPAGRACCARPWIGARMAVPSRWRSAPGILRFRASSTAKA